MKTSLKLTLAQTLFTILLYALGAIILGVALYPSVLLVHFYWTHSAHLVDGQRLLFLCFTLAGGYFIFGLTLIFTASFARVLLGLHVKEGVHSVGSPQMLKWMMVSALYIAVRFIRLRRRPRALPVDECEKAFASARCSPKGKASGNPSADNPRRFDSRSESAGGKTRYHGLFPWGSIRQRPSYGNGVFFVQEGIFSPQCHTSLCLSLYPGAFCRLDRAGGGQA